MKTLLLLLVCAMAHADITVGHVPTQVFDGKTYLTVSADEGILPRTSQMYKMINVSLFAQGYASYAYPASCDSDKRVISHLGAVVCAQAGKEFRKNLVYAGSYECASTHGSSYRLSIVSSVTGSGLRAKLMPTTGEYGSLNAVLCREKR